MAETDPSMTALSTSYTQQGIASHTLHIDGVFTRVYVIEYIEGIAHHTNRTIMS